MGAGEAPQAYQQLRGSPPHRYVGQAPGHRPTSLPLGPAGLAERVLKPDRHTALDHRALRREVLAHRGQPQGVQPQEGRQIRAGEGSLRHVEVSQVACVATPIIGGPRPLPTATTHPPHLCTSIGSSYHNLKREEPLNRALTRHLDVMKISVDSLSYQTECLRWQEFKQVVAGVVYSENRQNETPEVHNCFICLDRYFLIRQ